MYNTYLPATSSRAEVILSDDGRVAPASTGLVGSGRRFTPDNNSMGDTPDNSMGDADIF